MNNIDATVYTDFNGLAELKAKAAKDPDSALSAVAKQFESLFMHQMLKSMREASLGDGLLDNDQTLFYRDMFDQQLAIHLSESGGMGLAEVIERQLGGQSVSGMPGRSVDDYRQSAILSVQPQQMQIISQNTEAAASQVDKSNTVQSVSATQTVESKQAADVDVSESFIPQSPSEFVEKLWPWAQEAASMLGMKPQMLLAQAALESGWGKHVMRHADGNSANNLFGIKADRRWDGDKVAVSTLEYEEGVAVRKKAHFRAYESYRESFLDYVEFLKADPRYEKALQSADDPDAYFKELQKAGYATDPNYAKKIRAVLNGNELSAASEQFKVAEDQPI